MKLATGFLVLAMPIACAIGTAATAAARPQSLVVEPPSSLPDLAKQGGADMYLHDTNDGRTYLYIETNDGRSLSILNVTDPARITGVGQVPIAARGPFAFVKDLDHAGALIQYLDNSGFAVLDLKKYDRPAVSQTPPLALANGAEALGSAGLLLTSTDGNATRQTNSNASAVSRYDVVDASDTSTPRLLATVSGVRRRLSKSDTGTLFLLSENGVTVVRNLKDEAEHATELWQESRN